MVVFLRSIRALFRPAKEKMKAVDKALQELDKKEDIAAFLVEQNCHAPQLYNMKSCPVAIYLHRTTGEKVYTLGYFTQVLLGGTVVHPLRVQEFIEKFDQREYPHLFQNDGVMFT